MEDGVWRRITALRYHIVGFTDTCSRFINVLECSQFVYSHHGCTVTVLVLFGKTNHQPVLGKLGIRIRRTRKGSV